MRLPALDVQARAPALEKRLSKENRSFVIIAIIVIAVFAILVTTYLLTLRFRRPFTAVRTDKPRDKLPSLFSWSRWRSGAGRGEYSSTLQTGDRDTAYRGASISDAPNNSNDPERTPGVDRNTSVRSVMTLPSYSRSVRENERVLGREGERGGMDNVLELPETQDEQEVQRNEEMESLYQIRLARRAEAVDREARRQARRDARARGDHIALAEIRRRAEEAADLSVSQMLIAEHQGRNRDRRVSSVAYGDLGVARHDGTRLRANSHDSDNRPLLDGAASISGRSRGLTNTSTNTLDTHHRGLSVTSISRSSVDSRTSDDVPLTSASRSHSLHDLHPVSTAQSEAQGQAHDRSRDASPQPHSATSSSNPEATANPNPNPIPAEEAPAYEDPPDYTSPIDRRAPGLPMPSLQTQSQSGRHTTQETGTGTTQGSGMIGRGIPQLPALERLPSIRVVTTEPTPVEGEPPVSMFR